MIVLKKAQIKKGLKLKKSKGPEEQNKQVNKTSNDNQNQQTSLKKSVLE